MNHTLTVNGTSQYIIETGESTTINGIPANADVSAIDNGRFHILHNNKSYTAEAVEINYEEKSFKIRVNTNEYEVKAHDKFDELLKSLGMDAAASKKAADLKAPMPGLVVAVRVTEGQEVQKGDPLVVLEAMKMENILKAAVAGTVKKIMVTKGQAVEKNAVLLQF